jgi:hypothetical protein
MNAVKTPTKMLIAVAATMLMVAVPLVAASEDAPSDSDGATTLEYEVKRTSVLIELINEGEKEGTYVGGPDVDLVITITAGKPLLTSAIPAGDITLDGSTHWRSVKIIRDGTNKPLINIDDDRTVTIENIMLERVSTLQEKIIEVSNGCLTIGDGAVIDGKNISGTQSAVYVASGATFNMTGGEIRNNKSSSNGGGVYAANGSKIDMAGGTISGNTATTAGGGIFAGYINNGTNETSAPNLKFTMTGGTISNNTAKNGGGVRITSGAEFNMTGGTISGNEATNNGGGVSVRGYISTEITPLYYTEFNMTGGTISNNTAKNGGGVHNLYNSKVTIEENSTIITGNTSSVSTAQMAISDGGQTSIHVTTAGSGPGSVYLFNEEDRNWKGCINASNKMPKVMLGSGLTATISIRGLTNFTATGVGVPGATVYIPGSESYVYEGPRNEVAGTITLGLTIVTAHVDGTENKYDFNIGKTIVLPSKTGYDVAWYTDPAHTTSLPTTVLADSDSTYDAYPVYTLSEYTLTINLDGGNYADAPSGWTAGSGSYSREFKYGEIIILPTGPSKAGYTFSSWGSVPADSKMPALDLTVTAQYTENAIVPPEPETPVQPPVQPPVDGDDTVTIVEYPVSIDGTLKNMAVGTILIVSGDATGQDGKVFGGWMVNGTLMEAGTSIIITGDTVITSVWSTPEVVPDEDKEQSTGSAIGGLGNLGSSFNILLVLFLIICGLYIVKREMA